MRTDKKEKLILCLEDEVLVHLSQFPMPDESVTKVRQRFNSSNLDWDKLLYDARRHHLLGFIHYNASEHNLPLPEEVAREARKYVIIWSGLDPFRMLLPNSEFCPAALNIGLTEPEFRPQTDIFPTSDSLSSCAISFS